MKEKLLKFRLEIIKRGYDELEELYESIENGEFNNDELKLINNELCDLGSEFDKLSFLIEDYL